MEYQKDSEADIFHSEALRYVEHQIPQHTLLVGPYSAQVCSVLQQITQVELLEQFLHTRYQGQKRFSIEGVESLIPLIKILLASLPISSKTIVIGMSHRGRLSVLHHVVQKPLEKIFLEFEGIESDPDVRSGDVKYHKGFRNTVDGRELILLDNPSHLESIYPVALGYCRGVQDLFKDKQAAVPIILHGDAAIAGQGVVYETMQMHSLDAYTVGGAIHIIINNKVGFTADPKEYMSFKNPSDIAKAFDFPVIQVEADDILTLLSAASQALAIHAEGSKDVIIELIGYRRWGHNEGDDPSYTQPLQTKKIRTKPSFRQQVISKLPNEIQSLAQSCVDKELPIYQQLLMEKHKQAIKEKNRLLQSNTNHHPLLQSYRDHLQLLAPIQTGVPLERIFEIYELLLTQEEGFLVHETLRKQFKQRRELLLTHLQTPEELKIDWSMAEILAIATICLEGMPVRIIGQDSERGTFSQRHAVLVDQETGKKIVPLQRVLNNQELFFIQNSLLSEAAAVGFEYGYSLSRKEGVTIWEAQFGDFANGAQVYIDQYISCAEEKWGVKSNITLLLPHGYEGQGPEHSSARIERFLQLSAQDNWLIASPSTPAQYFHLLRRQVASGFPRKPLIVMTPKSLLRYPDCVSSVLDCSSSSKNPSCFKTLIDDEQYSASVTLLCTGKMFYFLKKAIHSTSSVSIIRIEQLYPFPKAALVEALAKRGTGTKVFWVQEEPENMGAANFIKENLVQFFISVISRGSSSATAAGLHSIHELEEQVLLESIQQIIQQDSSKGQL